MINGLTVGVALFLIGVYGIITNKNVIKIIMSMGIMSNGVILFFISNGYVVGAGPPLSTSDSMVDPVPHALMLTLIVINLSVLALGLSISIILYRKFGTLDSSRIRGLRG